MKILVELNNKVDAFNIRKEHIERFVNEFPDHEFTFYDSYSHFKENIAEADAAVVWFFPEHLYEKATKLRAIFTPAAGRDWVAEDPRRKVTSYFSSFHGHIIAESFLAMLFMNNNNALKAYYNCRDKLWDRNAFGSRKLLRNQNLLILGYGNIGRICAEEASKLGMEVVGIRRSLSDEKFPLYTFDRLQEVIGDFDHVLNLLPGGLETAGIVSDEVLACMKAGASFYNFGRGTTVDEEALVASLNNDLLAFAGLDVTTVEPLPADSPLWQAKNTFITPHSSCCYEDYLHLFIDELKEKL